MLRSALVLAVLALALVACSERPPLAPLAVQKAWAQYRAEPTENTYLQLIQANRTAAMEHGHPDDAQGVTHQLLALEAQSEHAERNQDLHLAQVALTRIDEIIDGDILETYDEVLPGFAERLLAARARVAPMLE